MAPVATLVLLPLLLLPHTLALCPTVTCAELPPNVCAMQLSESQFQINGKGCQNNYQCLISEFMDWESLARLSTVSFSCVAQVPAAPVNATTSVPFTGLCRAREFQKDFASKQLRILCDSDGDCLLQDGTYDSGACVCTPRSDAKGVCRPNPSNQAIYSQYWVDCGRFGVNSLTDQNEFLYFEMAFQYWVYEQSNLPCIQLFSELQKLQTLKSNFNWATVVATSGLLFVY